MAAFGAVMRKVDAPVNRSPRARPAGCAQGHGSTASSWALSLTAITWGLVNFGLLLWLPAISSTKGYSIGASRLLAQAR
jgi:putative MFS transporter